MDALRLEKPYLIFTKNTWLKIAEVKPDLMPVFTAEQVENCDKKTGLIGEKNGIEGYVSRGFDELLKD